MLCKLTVFWSLPLTTPRKFAEYSERMKIAKCQRCDGERLEPGSLGSFGLTFRPANTKFLTLSTNDVGVQANMCLDCGLIQLVGDLRKAQTLSGSPQKPH